MFSEEHKYVDKEKKTFKCITDNIESSFDDSDGETSDEGNSNKEN